MKKLVVALFVIAAVVALSWSCYGLDMNMNVDVKKKSCETACDKANADCTKKAQQEYDKGKDEKKKKASDLACSKAKEECYKKCSK